MWTGTLALARPVQIMADILGQVSGHVCPRVLWNPLSQIGSYLPHRNGVFDVAAPHVLDLGQIADRQAENSRRPHPQLRAERLQNPAIIGSKANAGRNRLF